MEHFSKEERRVVKKASVEKVKQEVKSKMHGSQSDLLIAQKVKV